MSKVGDVHWFATLTPPKPEGTDLRIAMNLSITALRDVLCKGATAKEAKRRGIVGGLISTEVTWSPQGQLRRDGSRVPYDGWHVHHHLLVEGGTVDDLRWLMQAWCDRVNGDRGAQDFSPLDDRRVGQLAKYVVKPIDLASCPVALARHAANAMHGRRMHRAWGTWRSWKRWLGERETSRVAYVENPTTGERLTAAELIRRYYDPSTRSKPLRTMDVAGTVEDGRRWTPFDLVVAIRAGVDRGTPTVKNKRGPPPSQGPPCQVDSSESVAANLEGDEGNLLPRQTDLALDAAAFGGDVA